MSGRVAGVLGMLALAGCQSIFGMLDPEPLGDGGTVDTRDARDDGPMEDALQIDAPAICTTWQAKHFAPCAIPAPGGDLVLTANGSPYTLDTTSGSLVDENATAIPITSTLLAQPGGGSVRLVSADAFTIQSGATLEVIGTYPLIVAGWGKITIVGTIDAGSRFATMRKGAGAGTACVAPNVASPGIPGVATGGASGGGGGGFRGTGGTGGAADDPVNLPGGIGGSSVTPPTVIRGGCPGAAGGKAGTATGLLAPATSETITRAGLGGGALELASRTMIEVSGRVLAGGGGGEGAPFGSACGGGGGGSGGYLGFDASDVMFNASAVVAANGGGGGGSSPFAAMGGPGSDGLPSAAPAPGGARGSTCGTPGANGGASSALNGDFVVTLDNCGGGGGGGAAGFVLVWSTNLTKTGATVSPPEQLNL